MFIKIFILNKKAYHNNHYLVHFHSYIIVYIIFLYFMKALEDP